MAMMLSAACCSSSGFVELTLWPLSMRPTPITSRTSSSRVNFRFLAFAVSIRSRQPVMSLPSTVRLYMMPTVPHA